MKIILKFHRISPKTALNICGYTYRPRDDDWIREVPQGRFHAKLVHKGNRIIDIHYDLFIEWRHVADFDMPMMHNAERKRILKFLYKFQTKSMTQELFEQILTKSGL